MKRPLKTEECNRILKLRTKGLSIAAISKELHRSKPLISAFINKTSELVASNTNGENVNGENSSLVPYQELTNETMTPSPKKKRKSTSSDKSEKKIKKIKKDTDASLTEEKKEKPKPNRVSFEYRCVIKHLTLKGWNTAAIYDDMKHVYKEKSPSQNGIEYWFREFKANPSLKIFDNSSNKIGKTSDKKKNDSNGKLWTVTKTIKNKTKTAINKTLGQQKKGKDNNTSSSSKKNEKSPKKLKPMTFKLFNETTTE